MMHRIRLCLICLLPITTALGAGPVIHGAAPIDAYTAVGSSFAHDNRLHQLGWTEAQMEAFLNGIRAVFHGAPASMSPEAQVLLQGIGERLQQLDQEQQRRRYSTEAFAQPGYLAQYLKDMQKRFELQTSDSGLSYGIKMSGQGSRPEPEDTVIFSYKVTAADLLTQLTQINGQRLRVKVKDVMPGLSEALQMMTTGSAAMLILPPELSYGSGEWPVGVERATPLVFTVVLHEIVTPP